MRKFYVLFVILCVACYNAAAQPDEVAAGWHHNTAKRDYVQSHPVSRTDSIRVLVTRVVDGDTFVCITCATCTDSIRIRVLNLDTFEKAKIPRAYKQAAQHGITIEQVVLAGKLATYEAQALLLDKWVLLHRGRKRDTNIDIYFRPLRYVRLEDGRDYSEIMRAKGLHAK